MRAGNATSHEERRAFIERLLQVWDKLPHLRLGQLVCNGAHETTWHDPYYTPDGALIRNLESLAR
jgi:hypothetical protein